MDLVGARRVIKETETESKTSLMVGEGEVSSLKTRGSSCQSLLVC